MRYDEDEEVEASKKWLSRVTDARVSEELLYVPSQLNKLGVQPKDVVDNLDWLREHSQEQPAVQPLELDYDGFPPWEWAEPIEQMVEDAIRAILDPEPGLPEFNIIASSMRRRKRWRGKGKTARVAPRYVVPR